MLSNHELLRLLLGSAIEQIRENFYWEEVYQMHGNGD